MEKYSKSELGFKLANPDAIGSFVKMRAKEYVGVNPSLDTVTLTTSGNFTAFVFDGATVTLGSAIAISAGNVDDIKAAIEAVVATKEGNVWVNVEYAGGDLLVEHIGHLRLASIAVSDVAAGAQQATTNLDTLVSVARYSATDIVGDIGPVIYKGGSEALANDPYAHSGTPLTDDATADDLAADLETALVALGLTLYGDAVVAARDDVSEAYDVYVYLLKADQAIRLDGADIIMTEDQITEEFV